MHRFSFWLIFAIFLGTGCSCFRERTTQQIIRDHQSADRQINRIIQKHNPFPGIVKPDLIKKPTVSVKDLEEYENVETETDDAGTVYAFVFDDKACFSKEKSTKTVLSCLDLRTKKNARVNVSELEFPDDMYIDIGANAEFYIFSFEGKTCLSHQPKAENGLKKCWDPRKLENVSIGDPDPEPEQEDQAD